jgi:phosphomevalonate kinase
MYNNSFTAIDNIFIDKVKYENYCIHPLVNELSNHDTHVITINNITVDKRISKTQSVRKFNTFSISQCAVNLNYENWDNVFIEEDINTVFNNFLNTDFKNLQLQLPVTENIQYT